jgi:RimJ/RimL family protein N-acetyltransferase
MQNVAIVTQPTTYSKGSTRVILEPLCLLNLGDIHSGYTKKVAQYMYSQPVSIEETSFNIINCFRKQNAYYFSITEKGTGRFLGCAGIKIFQKKVSHPRFWIIEKVWGKGYGTEVFETLLAFIDANDLPKEFVYASVEKHNKAAIRVLERLGGEIQRNSYLSQNSVGKTNHLISYRFRLQ